MTPPAVTLYFFAAACLALAGLSAAGAPQAEGVRGSGQKPVAAAAAQANTVPGEKIMLKENFAGPLSPDWFWGLGTWTAKDGVLRGYESGPRRHGPVKMRRFPLREGTIEFEFRLIGQATFAGIIFNGAQDRGHLFHVAIARDKVRVTAHPKKGETVELGSQPRTLPVGEWHRVKVEIQGTRLSALVDGVPIAATHPCIGEEKLTFGLTGDSGGPEGEKVGALEFRQLRIAATR